MNIFPEVGLNVSGGSSVQPQKVNDEQQEQKQNVNTEKTVTVFSNYDSNSDKSVNYSEANNNSLFTRGDFSKNTAANLNSQVSAEVKANIQKMALAKYNPTNAFKNILSNFNSKTGSEKLTFADGNVNQSKVDAQAKALDQKAITDAQTASAKANKEIFDKYNEALNTAFAEYTASNGETGDVSKINTDDAKGQKANAKEFNNAQNTKEKTEIDAFSTYDNNKDKHIKYDEASSKFNISNEINNLKPTNMGDTKSLDAVKKMTGLDVTQMFKEQLASFDVKTGKETLKFEGKVNDSEVKAKIAEMDKKADTAISKANQNANDKIAKNYTEALDKAYKQFVASGANMTQPNIPQVDPNSLGSIIKPPTLDLNNPPKIDIKSIPVSSTPTSSSITIKSGDTLSKLAQTYGTTVDALMQANPQITDKNKIKAGASLNLPAGITPKEDSSHNVVSKKKTTSAHRTTTRPTTAKSTAKPTNKTVNKTVANSATSRIASNVYVAQPDATRVARPNINTPIAKTQPKGKKPSTVTISFVKDSTGRNTSTVTATVNGKKYRAHSGGISFSHSSRQSASIKDLKAQIERDYGQGIKFVMSNEV